MDYERLKTRHRAERDAYSSNLSLRVHRALSWLDRAEQLSAHDDADGQFILLWIAFNAAYATEIDEKSRDSEQQTFRGFLEKLTQLDVDEKRFEALVWTEFPKSIRVLLDNPYVFQNFWKFQNGTLPEAEWKKSFTAANKAAHVALGRRDAACEIPASPGNYSVGHRGDSEAKSWSTGAPVGSTRSHSAPRKKASVGR